jgi:hypothetical protein
MVAQCSENWALLPLLLIAYFVMVPRENEMLVKLD